MWQTILSDFLIALVPAAAAAVLRLVVPEAFAWLAARAKWAKSLHAYAVLEEIVAQFVTDASTAVVNQLKADGRWNPDEAARIKKAVIGKVLDALPDAERKVLAALTDDIEALVGAKIEQQVAINQASGIQAKIGTLATPPLPAASASAPSSPASPQTAASASA